MPAELGWLQSGVEARRAFSSPPVAHCSLHATFACRFLCRSAQHDQSPACGRRSRPGHFSSARVRRTWEKAFATKRLNPDATSPLTLQEAFGAHRETVEERSLNFQIFLNILNFLNCFPFKIDKSSLIFWIVWIGFLLIKMKFVNFLNFLNFWNCVPLCLFLNWFPFNFRYFWFVSTFLAFSTVLNSVFLLHFLNVLNYIIFL